MAQWFVQVGAQAWQSERPAVVVVPTRGHSHALKAQLVAAKQSVLGLQFVTPPYLRALLWADAESPLPQREHLRLLLAHAAEEQLDEASLTDAQRLAAISVRRTPDHLLRLLDQLDAAGRNFEDVDLPAFQPLVRRFRAHLSHSKFSTFPETDRAAFARAKQHSQLFSNLLVTGFHGAHWPLWHLLRAAVQTAEKSTIILQNPRTDAADLDAAWIGSWEEIFGEAEVAEGDDEVSAVARETIFLVGLDSREQAEAITAATEQFLADENCSRLGIIFPSAGALPRLVASMLKEQGIAHYDAMGQMVPGVFESADFWAWMELQRTPRLHALLRFLTTLDSDHSLFAKISRAEIENGLQKALGDLAIDHLALLSNACRQRGGKGDLISPALHAIQFFPERASFAEFLRATSEAFVRLQWTERWLEIEKRTAWAATVRGSFSRTLYLKWLSEVANSFHVTREVLGQHPYARVQILTPAQAEDQSWSHLILVGLNETSWPATNRGDFLPAAQIDAFNCSVQKINRTATRRGRQGEGHVTVREGKTLFLGAAQQRQLALAQFASLLESARHGVALTASVVQEATPERVSNPSEFFSRVFHEIRGFPLSQVTMLALRATTRQWLRDSKNKKPQKILENAGIAQTRTAYAARRKIESAGEYDFALRESPHEIKPLSVSDAEAILKSPALIWMKRYLGVEGAEDSTYAWNATLGKWTHEWLAAVFGRTEDFVPFPRSQEIAPRILAAAERKRAEVRELCRLSGATVPDWWDSGWENALCLSQTLGSLLGMIDDWKWAAPEWRLETQPIALGHDRSLLLHGRADLLLGKTAPPSGSLVGTDLWILDFKTGNKKSIAPRTRKKDEPRPPRVLKMVVKGEAMQLALYTLAAMRLGAQRVGSSILSPVVNKPEPQLHDDDFANCHDAFRELARMQTTGIFGIKGSLRGAFNFTKDYPIATLAIDPDIIDERWELTHPDLVAEEESWS